MISTFALVDLDALGSLSVGQWAVIEVRGERGRGIASNALIEQDAAAQPLVATLEHVFV